MFKEFTIVEEQEPEGFIVRGQEFRCHPSIPAGVFIQFGELSDDSSDAATISGLLTFLKSALFDDDYKRFHELVHTTDADVGIPLSTLVDIVTYLGELYSGQRPTGENSSSSLAKRSTGGDSTVGASVEALTYSRSPQTAPSI